MNARRSRTLVSLTGHAYAFQVNFRELVFPSKALPASNLEYNQADLVNMAQQGEADAVASIQKLKSQASGSCAHPSKTNEIVCTHDRDCYSWAVSHCGDARVAEAGRCNMNVDSADSYGACDFKKVHMDTCCVDHPWKTRSVTRKPRVKTKLRADLGSKCYSVAVSGGGDRCVKNEIGVKGFFNSKHRILRLMLTIV